MRTIAPVALLVLTFSRIGVCGADPLGDARRRAGSDAVQLVSVGYLFVEAGRFKEAKKVFLHAQRLNPRSGESNLGLAKIEIKAGNFWRGKRACQRIGQKFMKKSVGNICSGWFWLEKKRTERADEEFLRAIEMGDFRRGKTGMGEVYRQRGVLDKALGAFDEAIEAGASYMAHVGRGLTLEAMNDVAGALTALERAVLAQPASCLAQYHYGRLLPSAEKALIHLDAALVIRPDFTDAILEKANVLLERKKFGEAAAAFREATLSAPNRGDAWFGLGRALLWAGNEPEAKEALTKTVQQIPTLAEAHLLLAELQKNAGDLDGAGKSFQNALRARPNDAKVCFRAGDFYFQLKRYTSARSYLMKAVAINPNHSRAHLVLGRIACTRRLFSEGLKHLEKAATGDLKDVEPAAIEKLRRTCKP